MYGATCLASHFPRSQTPSVTAGLKCPPEMCPPAKIITMSTAPIASAGMTPAALGMTVHPTVSTRKKVPINSAIYFLICRIPIELEPGGEAVSSELGDTRCRVPISLTQLSNGNTGRCRSGSDSHFMTNGPQIVKDRLE